MISVEHSRFYSNSNHPVPSYFDHVLIDVQHILHVVVRRSENHTHALQLLTQELDKCITLATPTLSLVLALDGSPCAAKRSTQRQRRRAIMKRSLWLQTKLPLLLHSMHGSVVDESSSSSSSRFKAWKKRLRKDERALCITPGHEFMQRASDTCQQWASRWSTRRTAVDGNTILYHVSASLEPGEGELKLVYWLNHPQQASLKRGGVQSHHTVAFMGGDSDLVLLGLAIPIQKVSHIYVIFPSESYKSCILSLAHLMQSLVSMLSPIRLSTNDWYHVRLDLILLFVMNGNDYLPKLRGSPGLHSMFQTYIQLLKDVVLNKNTMTTRPFFILQPQTQSLNIPFCQSYFLALAPSSSIIANVGDDHHASQNSFTPLSCLQNLVNIGIVPGPLAFDVCTIDEDGKCEKEGTRFLRLSLGNLLYKVVLDKDASKKKTKQILAQMALDNLFQNNTIYMDTLFSLDDDSIESEDVSLHEESGNQGESRSSLSLADTSEYLKGLQWNLKMYQDGICSDNEYDYGRRLAPTVHDLLNYFNHLDMSSVQQ
jgi:5'-3' exonuclease